MKEFIFVFGSSDGKIISNSHFGDSKNFYIYKLKDDGTFEFFKEIKNTVREMEHATINKMQSVLQLFNDGVDLLVVKKMSQNFFNIAKKTRYQPILVRLDDSDELFVLLKNKFEELFTLIEKRKIGKTDEYIPEF